MDDATFLEWIAARLVNVYNENENTDIVRRTKEIAEKVRRYDKEKQQ